MIYTIVRLRSSGSNRRRLNLSKYFVFRQCICPVHISSRLHNDLTNDLLHKSSKFNHRQVPMRAYGIPDTDRLRTQPSDSVGNASNRHEETLIIYSTDKRSTWIKQRLAKDLWRLIQYDISMTTVNCPRYIWFKSSLYTQIQLTVIYWQGFCHFSFISVETVVNKAHWPLDRTDGARPHARKPGACRWPRETQWRTPFTSTHYNEHTQPTFNN